jgi:branched-subunit amino acid ABC-type transport system permease component
LLGLAAAGSVGYALLFFAAKPVPGAHSDFIMFGSYFAFSAICMLALALRLHRTAGAPLSLNHAH